MKLWKMIRSFGGALGCVALAACSIDSAPDRLGATPAGDGSRVRFDLYAEPLPDIPLPNDVASWPDPTSRTGVRINAALAAPTSMERIAREKLSRMEGWGTFQPITIAFDPAGDLAGRAAIDLSAVSRRHQHDDYDFVDDAVYLVDLETGVPVPLDLGEGAFNPILKNLGRYWRNDARANEENILFETYDEAAGKVDATYSPALDTDFDGVLDRPNLADGSTCAAWQDVASFATQRAASSRRPGPLKCTPLPPESRRLPLRASESGPSRAMPAFHSDACAARMSGDPSSPGPW